MGAKKRVEFEVVVNDNATTLYESVLMNRGIKKEDIYPDHTHLIDPRTLGGIDKAVERLIKARECQELVLIIGDYDTDGVMASAIMYQGLEDLGFNSILYKIPSRQEHGYGLTKRFIEDIKGELKDVDLIITVDCGTNDKEGMELISEINPNADIIITDHHQQTLIFQSKNLVSIVNPNCQNSTFKSKALAGCGVGYYVILALFNRLKELEENPKDIKYLTQYVAIGTIADIVELDYNNRILLGKGLIYLNNPATCSLGLVALAINNQIKEFTTTNITWIIAPLLNSAGRIATAELALELLIVKDRRQATLKATNLNYLNNKRKALQNKITDQLGLNLGLSQPFIIEVIDKAKHAVDTQGVNGIIASKLKATHNKPVIIFSETDDNLLVGSGRSVESVNLLKVLKKIEEQEKNKNLILHCGGHRWACGLTIHKDNLQAFKTLFKRYLNKEDAVIRGDGKPIYYVDGIHNAPLTACEVEELERLPVGKGFTKPLLVGDFLVINKKIYKEKHLELTLVNEKEMVSGFMFFAPQQKLKIQPSLDLMQVVFTPYFDKNTKQIVFYIDAIQKKEGVK